MIEIATVRKRLEQALALAHAELEDPLAAPSDDVRRLAAAAMVELPRARAATLAEGHDLMQLVERLRATMALVDARHDRARLDHARHEHARSDDAGARSTGRHLRPIGA